MIFVCDAHHNSTCVHNANGKTCSVLDSDCSTRYNTLVLPDCDQFNTLRAFVIMSILVLGLSLLFRTINFCARSRNLNTLAGVLNFFACMFTSLPSSSFTLPLSTMSDACLCYVCIIVIFSLIAVAVGLNWALYSISESSAHLGAAAILLIVGWLLTLRLTFAWNRYLLHLS
jgi:hypothetical protein